MVSKRLSFQGWRLSKWVDHNKGTIKGVIVALVGLFNYELTGFLEPGVREIVTGLVVLAGKLVADSIDFYVSEVDDK